MRFVRGDYMLVTKKQNQFIYWITASCLIFMLAVILFTPFTVVKASTSDEAVSNLDTVGSQAGLVKADPKILVGKIIKVFLGFVGAIFFCIILYAGYVYMTSGGDPEKIRKAKQWMINGTIGLIIIFASYSIVSFIFNALTDKEGKYTITSTIPKGAGYGLSGNAFGEILSGTSPFPEQRDVPRNTVVVVSFKFPIDAISFIDPTGNYADCPAALGQCKVGDCPADKSVCGPINKANFKAFACKDMTDWPDGQAPGNCLNAVIADAPDEKLVGGYVLITEDRKTVVFNPYGNAVGDANYLGSSTEDVSYIVHLGDNLHKQEPAGVSIFNKPGGYFWRFTTGTLIDTTPPQVSLVIPRDQAGIDPEVKDGSLCTPGKDDGCSNPPKVFRNQIVIANFNEPVLPLFATNQTACNSGNNSLEAQLLVTGGDKAKPECETSHVPGNWLTGINQYRTVQFISSMECEGVTENSCGEKVFCLPSNKTLDGLIKAALVDADNPAAGIGTGIMDMAMNSLDGNKNGKADGPATDNYDWSFAVGSAIDLTPPAIQALSPMNASESVDPAVPIRATFNEGLEPSSVDAFVYLYGQGYQGWFDPNLEISDQDPPPVPSMNVINMTHGPFEAVPEGSEEDGPLYMPVIKSKVRDMRQNCFTSSRNDVPEGQEDDALTSLNANTNDASDCNHISDDFYGLSCCPLDDGATYLHTRFSPPADETPYECTMDGIER